MSLGNTFWPLTRKKSATRARFFQSQFQSCLNVSQVKTFKEHNISAPTARALAHVPVSCWQGLSCLRFMCCFFSISYPFRHLRKSFWIIMFPFSLYAIRPTPGFLKNKKIESPTFEKYIRDSIEDWKGFKSQNIRGERCWLLTFVHFLFSSICVHPLTE